MAKQKIDAERKAKLARVKELDGELTKLEAERGLVDLPRETVVELVGLQRELGKPVNSDHLALLGDEEAQAAREEVQGAAGDAGTEGGGAAKKAARKPRKAKAPKEPKAPRPMIFGRHPVTSSIRTMGSLGWNAREVWHALSTRATAVPATEPEPETVTDAHRVPVSRSTCSAYIFETDTSRFKLAEFDDKEQRRLKAWHEGAKEAAEAEIRARKDELAAARAEKRKAEGGGEPKPKAQRKPRAAKAPAKKAADKGAAKKTARKPRKAKAAAAEGATA